MAKIIYGNEISALICNNLKKEIDDLVVKPTLAVIIVGDDPASEVYVASKIKLAQKVGIKSMTIKLASNIKQDELNQKIIELNNNQEIDGILLQLPLPKHLSSQSIQLIDPKKDVDGLTITNIGKLHLNQDCLIPCTPKGIIKMLDTIGFQYDGQNAVVIGRSNLVGLPIAKLLEGKNCTVTICHSKTKNLKAYSQKADLLIVAVGQPKFITSDYIKKNAIVIDVGINRIDGKLCGDVDFDDCLDQASYMTPVPKGVGPMTVTMLLENTLKAYYDRRKEND